MNTARFVEGLVTLQSWRKHGELSEYLGHYKPHGMIFLSDEDMEVKVLVETWLDSLSDEQKTRLTPWINELFYKAMDWVLKDNTTSNSNRYL